MSWDLEHGCCSAGEIGDVEHVGNPLTVEQIGRLLEGQMIVVTWSGGNGPWLYAVRVEGRRRFAISKDAIEAGVLVQWHAQDHPINRVTLA
jgi:hypothetical protein